jgi:opacity protein-like surface antigen
MMPGRMAVVFPAMQGAVKVKRAFLVLTAVAALARPAAAEIEPGLKVGINSAKVSLASGDDEGFTGRTGPVAGGSLYFRGERFGLQAEALYTVKGFAVEETSDGTSGNVEIRWLEVPVLLRAELMSEGSVRPYVVAGPTIAFKIDSKLTIEQDGVSVNLSELEGEDLDESISSTDVGAAAGVGVQAKVGGLAIEVEGRYTLGFSNLDKDDNDTIKSRTATLSVGVRF